MGIARLDEGRRREVDLGHLRSRWTYGLTYLAYGMRDPADVCFYPRSNKVAFRGIGVIARVESLDYWDGRTEALV